MLIVTVTKRTLSSFFRGIVNFFFLFSNLTEEHYLNTVRSEGYPFNSIFWIIWISTMLFISHPVRLRLRYMFKSSWIFENILCLVGYMNSPLIKISVLKFWFVFSEWILIRVLAYSSKQACLFWYTCSIYQMLKVTGIFQHCITIISIFTRFPQ